MTDYRARKRAITSKHVLLVVRVTDKNISSQFVQPAVAGDTVLASAHSRQLLKMGWKGSLKSTPASYLLGLHAGKVALGKGVKGAILYVGVDRFIRGSRVAAFVKGVTEAGVEVPVGEEVFPSDDRLTGKSIADYASKMSKEDNAEYKRVFSGLLKNGFKPEEYPAHVAKAKATIVGGGKK